MNIWICLSWGILVVGVVSLILSYLYDRERVLTNHLIIMGSFEAIVFYSEYAKTVKICLSCIFVCILFYWILIWSRSIKRHKKRIICARIKKSLSVANSIMGVFLGCFIVIVSFNIFGKKTVVKAETEPVRENVVVTYGDEYGFRENADVIANFREEKWNKLDKDERREAAQRVAYCEARYWGIWTPLTVEVKDFESDDTRGCYNDQNYTIYIDEEHLMNGRAKEVLETICHEAYHAYSFRMIDLYKQTSRRQSSILESSSII